MHLAHNGEPLDARRLNVDGRFDGGRLSEWMDDGAALLLLGLEKWFASLQEPTETLARALEADISVNAYIGGPRSRGFRACRPPRRVGCAGRRSEDLAPLGTDVARAN